jgi:hypothetical protein
MMGVGIPELKRLPGYKLLQSRALDILGATVLGCCLFGISVPEWALVDIDNGCCMSMDVAKLLTGTRLPRDP